MTKILLGSKNLKLASRVFFLYFSQWFFIIIRSTDGQFGIWPDIEKKKKWLCTHQLVGGISALQEAHATPPKKW